MKFICVCKFYAKIIILALVYYNVNCKMYASLLVSWLCKFYAIS